MTVVTAIAVLLAFSAQGWAQNSDVGGKRDVSVMTLNLYVGADFTPVTTGDPQDVAKLLSAVVDIHNKILASDFLNARSDALARRIVERGPDIVALQEVSLLRRQHPGDAIAGGMVPATTIERDYLAILLDALERHGGRYRIAAEVEDSDVEVPLFTGSGFDDVRITDRDVILVRSDLPPGQLRVLNSNAGNFAAAIPLPLGPSVRRGWCSIDVQVRGRAFRFMNTHLEDVLPPGLPDFQGLQALELLARASDTPLPVLLAGDFNADGNGVYGRSTYELLLHSGFVDVWPAVRPLDPGLTWGHDELLANPSTPFSLRLDMLFYRGGSFEPLAAETIDPVLGSTPPLWISDHAALFFRLAIH
jgi:endonuclease/exonuclease/phosphatase family metal-dependent hydrolase